MLIFIFQIWAWHACMSTTCSVPHFCEIAICVVLSKHNHSMQEDWPHLHWCLTILSEKTEKHLSLITEKIQVERKRFIAMKHIADQFDMDLLWQFQWFAANQSLQSLLFSMIVLWWQMFDKAHQHQLKQNASCGRRGGPKSTLIVHIMRSQHWSMDGSQAANMWHQLTQCIVTLQML